MMFFSSILTKGRANYSERLFRPWYSDGYGGDARCLSSWLNPVNSHHYVLMAMVDDVDVDGDCDGDDDVVDDDDVIRCLSSWLTW